MSDAVEEEGVVLNAQYRQSGSGTHGPSLSIVGRARMRTLSCNPGQDLSKPVNLSRAYGSAKPV
jgi:hypothetical protein